MLNPIQEALYAAADTVTAMDKLDETDRCHGCLYCAKSRSLLIRH